MSKIRRQPTVTFCQDDDLGYQTSRTRFPPGEGLVLDEAYRRAHLPLVAPDHPRVIASSRNPTYRMGRHARTYSVVLPIPAALLGSSYQTLEQELRAACFAPKIAWSVLQRRQDKLHATLCSSFSGGEAPVLDAHQRRELARLGPVHFEVRGLFSGNVNLGRLYLRVYPEKRNGTNILEEVQRILHQPHKELYLVGIFNLTDDLDPVEAAALRAFLERWWDRPIMQCEARHLWLLSATDDLVLDGVVEQTLPMF